MKKTLFVAGLDYSVNDDGLKELFSQYGTVASAKVVTDRDSGQSRGFGFVEMSNQEEAHESLKQLHNTTLLNRSLAVKFKEDKPSNGNSRNGGFAKRW